MSLNYGAEFTCNVCGDTVFLAGEMRHQMPDGWLSMSTTFDFHLCKNCVLEILNQATQPSGVDENE